MKKFISILLAGLLTSCLLTGCEGGGDVSEGEAGNYVAPVADAYNATINSIVATDALGRSFGESDVTASDKKVGLFYFVWHGAHTSGIFDISKLNEQSPEILWSTSPNANSPLTAFHYWSEPLYGYYSSDDPWVVERHLELFTMSGIDYLCLDLTNILLYEEAVTVLLDKILELQEQGWNPPRIMCMINGSAPKTEGDSDAVRMQKFYDTFYKQEKYASAWYCIDGKPVLAMDMANTYDTISQELKDYFHFRNTVWPFQTATKYNDMSWMDWVYPQRVYADDGYMSVSVAQHPSYAFSNSVNPNLREGMYNLNRGRGYDYTTKRNNVNNVLRGTNLAAQWQTAQDNRENVNEVMVTGWNEWIAQKLIGDGVHQFDQVTFVDTCDMEFSRDLEMMKGGYADNFYLQNMQAVRQFKTPDETAYAGSKGTPADLQSAFTGARVYKDIVGDALERNWHDTANKEIYTNTTNRNDIVQTEVMNDGTYLYIKVTTKEDVVFDYQKQNNLNILLSVQGVTGYKWNGYNFIVNRIPAQAGNGTVKLEKVSASDTYAFTEVCACESYLGGTVFAVRIPLKELGVTNAAQFTVDFKVADGISDPSDIENYYIDGDCAPIGRLNYRYNAGL